MRRRKLSASAKGLIGEEKVVEWLTGHGINAILKLPRSPYDVDCSGVRVEVKTSAPSRAYRQLYWTFTVHSHRSINRKCDIFVLRLQDVPDRGDVFVVVPAPIKKLSVTISERQLATKWLPFTGNLAPLRKAIEQRTA